MLSNDVSRFDYALFGLNYIWIAPIQIIIMSYIIYQEVGWAALIGMSVLLLTIPFQGKFNFTKSGKISFINLPKYFNTLTHIFLIYVIIILHLAYHL